MFWRFAQKQKYNFVNYHNGFGTKNRRLFTTLISLFHSYLSSGISSREKVDLLLKYFPAEQILPELPFFVNKRFHCHDLFLLFSRWEVSFKPIINSPYNNHQNHFHNKKHPFLLLDL